MVSSIEENFLFNSRIAVATDPETRLGYVATLAPLYGDAKHQTNTETF
jgi:hypothetical protein